MSAPIPNTLYAKVSDLLGVSYVPVNAVTGLDYNGNAPMDATNPSSSGGGINAFLAQATASRPVVLKLDIGIACYGSIIIPATGNVTIEGCGPDTGIFMMPGSNSHIISNQAGRLGAGYPNFSPNTTAPAQSCVNVNIANLFMNGNRGSDNPSATTTATVTLGSNQITVASASGIAKGQLIVGTGIGTNPSGVFVSSISGTTVSMVDQNGVAFNATAGGSGVSVSFYAGNSTGGASTPQRPLNVGTTNTFLCGINLVSGKGIKIQNVRTYNIPAFAHHLGNVSQVSWDDCFHDGTAANVINCDGIHVDGPASLLTISNFKATSMLDDVIALNCPEGYGGNITEVSISNCVFDQFLFGIFGYTWAGGANPKYTLTNVAISNVTGTPWQGQSGIGLITDFATFLRWGFEGTPNTTADSIDEIVVSNCSMRSISGGTGTDFMELRDSCGSIRINNCTFTPINPNPAIALCTTGMTVSYLEADLLIYVNSIGIVNNYGIGAAYSATGTSITRLVSNMQVAWPSNASGYTAVPYLIDSTQLSIGDLEIEDLIPTHVASLIKPQATTTGTVTSGSDALTVGSGTGIAAGQYVIMAGVPVGTTIASGSGTSWTMSQNASANETSVAASFLDWTGITTIRGTGVLGSLFPIPDSLMANGVHYISGTFATSSGVVTGKVAVKNTAGTVVPIG